MSITTVPTSIPPLPSGSSSTITKAPPPDEDSENPETDRLSGLPAEGYIKEKIEPQPEMLIEPKTEYMEETNNDDSVEDLTLDDDDDYENMMESGPGPSHSSNTNESEFYSLVLLFIFRIRWNRLALRKDYYFRINEVSRWYVDLLFEEKKNWKVTVELVVSNYIFFRSTYSLVKHFCETNCRVFNRAFRKLFPTVSLIENSR